MRDATTTTNGSSSDHAGESTASSISTSASTDANAGVSTDGNASARDRTTASDTSTSGERAEASTSSAEVKEADGDASSSSPQAAATTTLDDSAYRPWSQEDFTERASSFSVLKWFGKSISGAECARFGWRCTDVDMLACVLCQASLAYQASFGLSTETMHKIEQSFLKRLRSCHKLGCPWTSNPSPAELARLPVDQRALFDAFEQRKRGWVPAVQPSSSLSSQSSSSQSSQSSATPTHPLLSEECIVEFNRVRTALEADGFQFDEPVTSSLVLACCGWTRKSLLADSSDDRHVVAECTMCHRRAGLWNYAQSSTDRVAAALCEPAQAAAPSQSSSSTQPQQQQQQPANSTSSASASASVGSSSETPDVKEGDDEQKAPCSPAPSSSPASRAPHHSPVPESARFSSLFHSPSPRWRNATVFSRSVVKPAVVGLGAFGVTFGASASSKSASASSHYPTFGSNRGTMRLSPYSGPSPTGTSSASASASASAAKKTTTLAALQAKRRYPLLNRYARQQREPRQQQQAPPRKRRRVVVAASSSSSSSSSSVAPAVAADGFATPVHKAQKRKLVHVNEPPAKRRKHAARAASSVERVR